MGQQHKSHVYDKKTIFMMLEQEKSLKKIVEINFFWDAAFKVGTYSVF